MKLGEPLRTEAFKRKVLLVDDHPMMRAGLAQVINQQNDLRVCCEAGDARKAMQRVAASKPDLAVVDISLGDKGGLELIKDFQQLQPDLPVLVLSMHDELLYAERALRAGARGYVMKRAGAKTVLEAIRHILSGKVYVSERVSTQILVKLANARSAKCRSPIQSLTDREFQIFELTGQGLTTRQTAQRLHLSPKTVDAYRQRLKKKLNLADAAALILHAVRWVETQDLR